MSAHKRKADGLVNESSSKDRKKQKLQVARTIAVQASETKTKTNTTTSPGNPPTVLPSTIEVERFVEARRFEIQAMQDAIGSASQAATHRVWQTLPRHLRRRAASHDVRRVPLRLRDRARAEMDPISKKKAMAKHKKPGKSKQISTAERFLKRQRDKTWLETHLWHAKRMKMENMWGFRLAITPTEKAFRASFRASTRGSIIHDASYYSFIEIKGREDVIKAILDSCTDPQQPSAGSKRYTTGSRSCETHIYKPRSYPYELIAPVEILWRTVSDNDSKGKQKEPGPVPSSFRAVWIKVHPVAFDDVFATLQQCASEVLRTFKESGDENSEVELLDLSGHLNVFEFMGPKVSQVLKGALHPSNLDDRNELQTFWNSLPVMQTTASVPRGMIIGFTVLDPRLKFPPKNARLVVSSGEQAAPAFPSSNLARSDIWDPDVRRKLQKPHYKKAELDERRSKLSVPGTPLPALRQDDRVPVLLIQRSIESCNSNEGVHGWTMIVPSGWSMAFFASLVYTGTRVGGQRERQMQAFEMGTAYFPYDYICTAAYTEYADSRQKEDQESYQKKPPAKRPNFKKLGTASPWKADWNAILGLTSDSNPLLIPTQRSTSVADEVRPWSFRGPNVASIISKLAGLVEPAAKLLDEVNQLRSKRNIPVLSLSDKDHLYKGALVTIKVDMVRRGSPEDMAMLYSMTDDEVTSALKTQSADTEDGGESFATSQGTMIGYVTSGSYSLLRGEGAAIGAVSLDALLHLRKQASRLHLRSPKSATDPLLLVLLRNPSSPSFRIATIQALQQS